MRLSVEALLNVFVVPGFYVTFHKIEVCNSMERAYLELLSYSYTLTIATAFCSSKINRTDLMGVLPPRELYSKLHFCQCDRVDMQPWKWVPISKIRNGNGKLAGMSFRPDAKYITVCTVCQYVQYFIYFCKCIKECLQSSHVLS